MYEVENLGKTYDETYVAVPLQVKAFHWTRDCARRPLMDFANDLVRLNDVDEEFFVYNRITDEWNRFQYGDWIVRGALNQYLRFTDDEFHSTFAKVSEETGDYDEGPGCC